ncbi:MAG: efflux transporter outer membrane subunit [Caulobacteraceae bacterium]
MFVFDRPRAKALLAACAVTAVALGGCALGPDYRAPQPQALGVPQAYGVTAASAAPVDLTTWWRQLDDPLLTQLIDRATADNLDIAVSRSRLMQAREQLIQARSALLPSLSGSAGAGRTATWARTTTTTVGGLPVVTGGDVGASQFSLGLDASWQADLFGGVRRNVEAARASSDAALFNLAGVRTSVAGEVATNYIEARLAQARLAIARDTLKNQDDNLQIAGWRVQAGLVPSTDAEQARAQRAQTEAGIPLLETSFSNAANRLGVLTGQAPSALRQTMEAVGPIPHGPASVAAGIPADTLRQRPDVRAAERNLAAATAQIGVAEAQLYPSLTLTGSLDTTAARVASLGQTVTGQAFASLSQKIFDAGRLRSQVRSARASADGALATYKSTVLGGLEDVENAIQALNSAKARQASLAVALDASNNAAALARSQYRVGLTDFLTLLQSEQALLQARDSLASAQADQALALVRLYLALGGGWQPSSPETTGTPS